jgi:hypothetical protein
MTGTTEEHTEIVRWARAGALASGALGTVSMVGVLAGEVLQGEDFMGSSAAQALGWASFAAACALVLGVAGLGLVLGPALTRGMSRAWGVLLLATAAATGAAATLALVVPALVDRAPELATEPPAAVPATFILSGLAMGVSGVVLGLGLRRARPGLPRWVVNLFVVGSVVAIVPLPSRFFLLALGVAAVLAQVPGTGTRETAEPVGASRLEGRVS